MKNRFTTFDIKASICELNEKFLGMRVANVYDVDNRTYLIKLAMSDKKAVILLESGNRLHSTEFDWPKGMMPSQFSMKMRKHLRTRRLESITQLGADRIVDLQFGSGEAAYHVILELYDRGNIVLTDHEYTILNLLRPRTDQDKEVTFAVRETYPIEAAQQHEGVPTQERLTAIFTAAKQGDVLKRILNPHLVYGPAVIENCLMEAGVPANAKLGKDFILDRDMSKLIVAMENAENILQSAGQSKGYIIQRSEKRATLDEGEGESELLTFDEFHPMLFRQHAHLPYLEFPSFDKAVDEYFSKIGTQKLDNRLLQQEKSALKKLANVKKDHEKRLTALQLEQSVDNQKGQLIEMNLAMVDKAIQIVNSALANQIDWGDIDKLVKEAQLQKDPVACAITKLNLETNQITMLLKDPYGQMDDDEGEELDEDVLPPMKINIHLSLTAHANARKYFELKKHAAVKEQKTMDASEKAFKSAEKKTKQTLKEVQAVATINKARKNYWFEKFLWFITSENYLVVGGRDQQQNEILVKRYLRPGDLYVHADLHGACSCILKNPTGDVVPPKTLNEAGTMALCNSAAWDAKVVTSAWWVYHHQVSKTAPTGEYLTTGSFMVRGKKNFLPPSYLIYGFGIMFKVDDESIFRHKGERKVRTIEEESIASDSPAPSESAYSMLADAITEEEEEVKGGSDSSDDEKETATEEPAVKEEGSTSEDVVPKESFEMLDVSEVKAEAPVKEEKKEEEVKEEHKEEEVKEEEVLFPDTSINLQHVKGDKFSLHRHHSSVSTSSQASHEEEDVVYFGDDQPVKLAKSVPTRGSTQRLTAKQKRDMKKKNKFQQQMEEVEGEAKTEEGEEEEKAHENPAPSKQKQSKPEGDSQQPQQAPLSRRQKSKQKKIQKKYADQDEEDRQAAIELLAAAGACKEDTKAKLRMEEQRKKRERQHKKSHERSDLSTHGLKTISKGGSTKVVPIKGRLTVEDITVATLSMGMDANQDGGKAEEGAVAAAPAEDDGDDSDDEKQAVLDDENVKLTEDADILDSLTGQPVSEDLLLFAVPFCAPYQSLNSFKYKVKLTPGSTKRGKAAKAALNMFMHDKNMTQREKDLFKSLKDTDTARNMPGKVKVSAPNLQKSKGKK